MKDHTLDEAIVEAARFIKAAKKLRKYRAEARGRTETLRVSKRYMECQKMVDGNWLYYAEGREKAEVERAALDCRYKLADLRAGR